MSKLLALDQSSKITGYAIFDDDQLLTYGKFSLDDDDVGERLVKFRNKIQSLIIDNNINEVVFEDIQLQNNIINNVKTFKVFGRKVQNLPLISTCIFRIMHIEDLGMVKVFIS